MPPTLDATRPTWQNNSNNKGLVPIRSPDASSALTINPFTITINERIDSERRESIWRANRDQPVVGQHKVDATRTTWQNNSNNNDLVSVRSPAAFPALTINPLIDSYSERIDSERRGSIWRANRDHLVVGQHEVELDLDPDFHRPYLREYQPLCYNEVPESYSIARSIHWPEIDYSVPNLLLPKPGYWPDLNSDSCSKFTDIMAHEASFLDIAPLDASTPDSTQSTSFDDASPGSSSSLKSETLGCIECLMVFQRRCDLKYVMKIDLCINSRTDFMFSKHTRRTHARPFTCPIYGCRQPAFGLKTDLRRHLRTVHRKEGSIPKIGCTVLGCSKTFSRKDNMLRHVKSGHEVFSYADSELEAGCPHPSDRQRA